MLLSVMKRPRVYYEESLRRGENFTFSRWGDGEIHTLLGHIGMKNSNGCTFTLQLCELYRNILDRNPPYDLCLLRIALRTLRDELESFLKLNKYYIQWYGGDMFLSWSLSGKLFPIVKQLRTKRILYVGPDHCTKLPELGFFDIAHFIEPPKQNAILERDKIVSEIKQSVVDYKIEVIGYSSGLAAKVFIDDINREFGNSITQMDFGSMWDGYFDVPSRSYIRRGRVKFPDLLEVNTGKRAKKPGETFRYEG